MRLLRIVAVLIVVALLAGSVASAYPRPGRTHHASLGYDGEPANGFAVYPSISARYVAFASGAPNLALGDTNDMDDAFVRDLETGAIERVSVTDEGGQQDGLELADGRFEEIVTTAGLPDGDLRVWVRACLGGECGTKSVPLPRG